MNVTLIIWRRSFSKASLFSGVIFSRSLRSQSCSQYCGTTTIGGLNSTIIQPISSTCLREATIFCSSTSPATGFFNFGANRAVRSLPILMLYWAGLIAIVQVASVSVELACCSISCSINLNFISNVEMRPSELRSLTSIVTAPANSAAVVEFELLAVAVVVEFVQALIVFFASSPSTVRVI